MKASHQMSIALVVVAIGAAVFWQYTSADYDNTAAHAQDQPIAQGDDAPRLRAQWPGTSTSAPMGTTVLDNHSAKRLMQSLEEHRAPAGQSAYVRLQASQLCDESQLLGSDRPLTESTRALAAFRTSFCDDMHVSADSAQQEFLSLPADDPYVLAYGMSSELFEVAGAGTDKADEVAALAQELGKIMLSPESGLDAVIAAEALQATGLISPRVLALAKASGWSLKPSELSDAQLLGIQMNACRKFGGCGTNQLITLKACSEASNCELGLDANGVWRNRYSPSVYEAGKAFAESIAGK